MLEMTKRGMELVWEVRGGKQGMKWDCLSLAAPGCRREGPFRGGRAKTQESFFVLDAGCTEAFLE